MRHKLPRFPVRCSTWVCWAFLKKKLKKKQKKNYNEQTNNIAWPENAVAYEIRRKSGRKDILGQLAEVEIDAL